MYIYKVIDKATNEFLIESSADPAYLTTNRYNPGLEELLSRPNTETIKLFETKNPNWEKYQQAIYEINQDIGYNLKNGRFRVDDILKKKDLNYVYYIENLKENKYYVDCTRNVIDKLYRMFIDDRANAKLKTDINKYGKDNFKVRILEPVSTENKNKRWLEVFKVLSNKDGSNLYNKSKYEKLRRYENFKKI